MGYSGVSVGGLAQSVHRSERGQSKNNGNDLNGLGPRSLRKRKAAKPGEGLRRLGWDRSDQMTHRLSWRLHSDGAVEPPMGGSSGVVPRDQWKGVSGGYPAGRSSWCWRWVGGMPFRDSPGAPFSIESGSDRVKTAGSGRVGDEFQSERAQPLEAAPFVSDPKLAGKFPRSLKIRKDGWEV